MADPVELSVDAHPTLLLSSFVTEFPRPLGEIDAAPAVALLDLEAQAPLTRDEAVRVGIRALLRHGGYKPTGRGKPSSEYLVKAVGDGKLSSINAAVDACNAVSLASGLPISVVDLDRARGPFRVGLASADTTYVFNPSGQTIDVSGLLCLFDADGPCANAVKDAQRTKTSPETRRTLSVVWAGEGMQERLTTAVAWYRALLAGMGAAVRNQVHLRHRRRERPGRP